MKPLQKVKSYWDVIRECRLVFFVVACLSLAGCVDERDLDLPGYNVFKPQLEVEYYNNDDWHYSQQEFSVEILTNVDYKIKKEKVSWIEIIEYHGTHCLIKLYENKSRKSRSAKITFYNEEFSVSKTISIVQKGNPYFVKIAEPIDLGLSVKWASWNMGAECPEDFGDYCAWGERWWWKDFYDWSTYEFYDETSQTITKYSTLYGGDNNTHLDLGDDVASWEWGSKWRIPTLSEVQELCNNCLWEMATVNNVSGCRITGPNGNSIFLPIAGYRSRGEHSFQNSGYWTSTLYDNSTHAYLLSISSTINALGARRDLGFSIRPVYGEYLDRSQRMTVATGEVTDVTNTSATFPILIYNNKGENECGVFYSKQPNGKDVKLPTTSGGDFSQERLVTADDLEPNTEYYYRAYVFIKSEGRYEYGEIRTFRTSDWSTIQCEDENHVHAVDLGLSVKWACCNIDATTPEGYGGYYAWGETESKNNYDWNSYKWYNNNFTKYVIYRYYEPYIDNKPILDLEDDVAHAKLGGDWRMPTAAEIDELINECTWQYTFIKGVAGHIVTGPNGNSIFLPCAGYRENKDVKEVGTNGYYWSSVKTTIDYVGGANCLHFMQASWLDNQWCFENFELSRLYGRSVRPVCGEPKPYILVSTKYIERVYESGATVFGHVCGVDQDVTCGVMYGSSSTLSSPYETMEATTSNGEFLFNLRELTPNTTYYCRVYVCIDGEYTYGEIRSFTTSDYVSVETGDATDITAYEAVLSGILSDYDNDEGIGCGIKYGKRPDLSPPATYSGGWVTHGGTYTVTINNLEPNTEYYYRAYVSAGDETRYGDIRSFRTLADSNSPAKAIDLGLSVKWASCNVGATVPEEVGGYYAWGETEEKSDYSWSTYKWSNSDGTTFTKYCMHSYCGTVDNKTTLDSEDDVAHVEWGGSWRMPTKEELYELYNECTWQWTTINGVNGYNVVGPNGSGIFLPVAGSFQGNYNNSKNTWGVYSTSSLGESSSSNTYEFYFRDNGKNRGEGTRYYGRSVRPVQDK